VPHCGGRPLGSGIDRSHPGWTGRCPRSGAGWLRAFARNAETVRSVVTSMLAQLDPLHGLIHPARSLFADAVEVVGAVAAAARRRLGVVGAVSPWQLASAVTDGRLLAPGGAAAVAKHDLTLGAARRVRKPRPS
jgi:hypothetical protein